MIHVSGHSITPIRMIPEDTLRLIIKEREITAELTPQSLLGATITTWMMGEPGTPAEGMVFRPRSIRRDFHLGTATISLEHIICALRDSVLFKQITPATITGNAGATTCTAKQAVQYILNRQSDWTLGRWSSQFAGRQGEYTFENENCYDALIQVMDTLEGAFWSLDTTQYPFKLNVDYLDPTETFSCELRPGRNLRTLSYEQNRSGMFTRFYPIGKDGLEVTGRYIEIAGNPYGTVAHIEKFDDAEDEDALTLAAAQAWHGHETPQMRLTADVIFPHGSTEPLDQLAVGKMCRVCADGEVFTARIVQMEWQDAHRQPDAVKVIIGSENPDVCTVISSNWHNITTRL